MVDWQDYVVTDSGICHGQATIRGTRIPVVVVLTNLAAGMSSEELLRNYPSLTPESIRGALAYCAMLAEG